MPLVAITCPSCHAPVEATAEVIKCRYCGASLRNETAEPDANSDVITRTDTFIVLERVGPSNRARAWDVLTKRFGASPDDAEKAVRSSPAEVLVGGLRESPDEVVLVFKEAGITARIAHKEVVVAVVPRRSVHLERTGANKAAVMKLLRKHLDCELGEAKSLAERAPCVLSPSMGGEAAKSFVEALIEAGAIARLDKPL